MMYWYSETVSHDGLHKCRVIKAATQEDLDEKKKHLLAEWDEQYKKKCDRESRIKNDEDSLVYARECTEVAQKVQDALDRILLTDVEDGLFSIDELKDNSQFEEPKPSEPILFSKPSKPDSSESQFNIQLSGLSKLSKKKTQENDNRNRELYEEAVRSWEIKCQGIDNKNSKLLEKYEEELESWNNRYHEFEESREAHNFELDKKYELFVSKDVESIEWMVRKSIERSTLPFSYDRVLDVEYNCDSKMVVIDYFFPVLEDIPKLKSISYVKTRREFKESFHPESYLKKKYESTVYQMVLQALHNVFGITADMGLVEAVAINGRLHTIDKSTGKEIEPCVLSINVTRESFNQVNLYAVDPKSWFKASKGVSAASIATVTPIPPLITMSREDKRFVEGYGVMDNVDEGSNLALMDWQDFENLIRELFEKEFQSNGGEVKITRASRDGGVDAIAYDPDPIRGGKIVIQAKRYSNVVGVSFVRDLYGTVMNEGATKGILVTTSNYGNDAYDFVKDKPLTLLNGANLLDLLSKHGYKARIDLKEAKATSKDN